MHGPASGAGSLSPTPQDTKTTWGVFWCVHVNRPARHERRKTSIGSSIRIRQGINKKQETGGLFRIAGSQVSKPQGAPLFKIARLNSLKPLSAETLNNDSQSLSVLSQFCATETWSGDLSTGLLKVGERAMGYHRLDSPECGLLNLIRCYDPADRTKILELFEQATTHSSTFCFSTTITGTATNRPRAIFCMGESSGLEKKFSGRILGVFLFPHFTLEPGHTLAGSIYAPQ